MACAGKAPPSPAQGTGGAAAASQTAAAALQSDAVATIAAGRATIEAAEAGATVVAARETVAAAEATAAAPTRPPPTITLVPSSTPLPRETAAPPVLAEPATRNVECDARIAYVGEWGQIWTMKPDGSDKRLLVKPGVDVWRPRWFPDGKRLVFTTHAETYFVNSDGRGLTKQPYDYEYPVISPNGQRLAGKFIQYKATEYSPHTFVTDDLVALDVDGKHLTNLTGCNEGVHCNVTNPTWSPDGLWIAAGVNSSRGPGVDLWLFGSDGSERRKILSLAGVIMPSWSPDGARIAFLTREPVIDGKATIWVVNTDGSGLRQLPLQGLVLHDAVPTWSPDGKKLAFVAGSGMQQNRKVYTISVDGGQPVALGNGWDPSWQPCPLSHSK